MLDYRLHPIGFVVSLIFGLLLIVTYYYIFKNLGNIWIKQALEENGLPSSSRLIAFLTTILFLLLCSFMGIIGIYLIVSGQGHALKNISDYFNFLYTPMIAYIPYAFNNLKSMINPTSQNPSNHK